MWTRALVAMTRPTQIALIGMIFANGVLLALWRGAAGLEDALAAGPALALLILAAASIHLANEAADHDTDRLTTRTAFSGGSGALEASGLSPRVPLVLSLTLALATIVAAVSALVIGALAPVAAAVLMFGLGAGLAYSLPPLAFERRGWGEPLNALLGGMALPLFGVAAVAASIAWLDLLAFLPFFFITLASVMATAWPDRDADAATGKRTMQVRLEPGVLRAVALAATLGFLATTLLSVVTGAMPAAVAGLLATPLLLLGLLRYTRRSSPIANVAAMVALGLVTTATLVASVLIEPGPA